MVENIDKPHLVWVTGMRGVEPQKWSELNYGLNNRLADKVVHKEELTPEQASLDIPELVRMFGVPRGYVYDPQTRQPFVKR